MRGTEIARQSAAEAAALNLFREEFFSALGQALPVGRRRSSKSSRAITIFTNRQARRAEPRAWGEGGGSPSGPFVDRCGLLLDPSMLEQARRAAGKFETQLRAATLQALKRVFAARREN